MALIGNIALGMSVNSQQFSRGVASAASSMSVLGAAAAGLGAVGVGAFFVSSIKKASDFNEALSSTESILGKDVTAAVSKFADEMSSKFGLVKKETLEAASGFGGIAKGLGGLGGDELANFTTKFTKLAADLQSNKNIASLSEAAMAIQTGLSGEQSDVLKKMGIIITENTMKQYALAHGMNANTQAMSEQTKFMLRATMVAEGLSFAQGDLERTAGAAANQFRKAGGGVDNFMSSIGQVLLPAVTSATSAFNELLASVIETFSRNRDTIAGWADTVKTIFDGVGIAIRESGTVWQIFELKAGAAIQNTINVFRALGENAVAIAVHIGTNLDNIIEDSVAAAGALLKNFGANLSSFGSALFEFLQNPTKGFAMDWTPLLDGFKATTEKMPDLIAPVWVDVQSQIDELTGKLVEKQVAHAASAASVVAQAAQKPLGAMGDSSGPKLAKVIRADSAEAYSAIVRARSSQRDPGQQTVNVLKEQLQIQKETLKAVRESEPNTLDMVAV